MQSFPNAGGGAIILAMADKIVENRAYLSEIDGKIGDGDHGVNMAKGFGMAAERLKGRDATLTQAMEALSEVLMGEIGGSMGPLYGMTFTEFADALGSAERVDPALFSRMLRAGLEGVRSIGSAEVGDKTLIDAFVPAADAFCLGLLSGLGQAILVHHDAEGYQALLDRDDVAAGGRPALLDAEVEAFGLRHTDVSAEALAAWQFPREFSDALARLGDAPERSTPWSRCLATALEAASRLVDPTGPASDVLELSDGVVTEDRLTGMLPRLRESVAASDW